MKGIWFLFMEKNLKFMVIESIELKNFRNYKDLNIEFDKGTNILYGDNAQGKTNILEAVYVSGTSKSHKSSKDREMIQFGMDECHIKTKFLKKEIPYRVDIHLKKNRPKGIAINGVPIKKASELFGIMNIVVFSPEDLSIIKNGPQERRRFIDLELCQLDKLYVYNLVNYNKALIQRNQLLKDLSFQKELIDTLDIWDMQLEKYGRKLIERRKSFLLSLGEVVTKIHKNLTGEKEELHILYEPNVEPEGLLDSLKRNRDRDIKQKITNTGPHRDDIGFCILENDLRKYGSQGQQRTAALSLNLAEIEIVKKITGDMPVLLLDDVLSELDSKRQNHLLNHINEIQTLITCTGLDELIENRFEINRIYHIVNGTVGGKE